MIVLLGGTGYIGQAFARELRQRGETFASLTRKEVDYTRFEVLVETLRRLKPTFLINAAGFSGKPNVDACERAQADTLLGNTLLPQTVAHACHVAGVPWGHVSSGCIYSGARVVQNGVERIERDLMRPDLQQLLKDHPGAFHGFRETDPPNFTFREPPCSFYSGTKALAEEALASFPATYLWRLRIPFDEDDSSRNYLTKIQRYQKVYNNVNSLSHRGDFVRACLDLWERRAPFGVYNVTNPGFTTARQAIRMIEEILKPARQFDFWPTDAEFYRLGAVAPRSNCILDVSKLLATGVRLRTVNEAVEEALTRWNSIKIL